jgi:flagellar motor switch protein FliN/FliY
VEVREARLPEVAESEVAGVPGQIDILLEAPMLVQACLGEVELKVKSLLQLAPGSVVKLDKQAGEPIDLVLRGSCFARGQLVVVGNLLGVRVTEILSRDNLQKEA